MTLVKNVSSYQKVSFVFLKVSKLLGELLCVPSFKSINSSYLSRKKYDGGNFTPSPVSYYEVKIRLWE